MQEDIQDGAQYPDKGDPEVDDGYYNVVEKAIYEKPRPEAESPEVNFQWQKGGLLGSGGFGKVFLGLIEETGEMIAVKEVQLVGDPQQQKKEVCTSAFHSP